MASFLKMPSYVAWVPARDTASLYFFKIFFDVAHFKAFIEFVTILLLFYILFLFLAARHVRS